jgi:ABC-type transporter Mla subunit MlaD
MSATRNIPVGCMDQLDQIGNELTTIWLALGNTTDIAADYLVDVREALNGVALRLREVRREMEEGPRS